MEHWKDRTLGDPAHRIYIASTLSNWERVDHFIRFFEANKITITYNWTKWAKEIFAGTSDEDPDWSRDALHGKAMGEMLGVMDAKHVLVLLPGGKGTHVEFGAFFMMHYLQRPPVLPGTQQLEWSAPITLLDEEHPKIPTSFHYLKSIYRAADEDDAKQHVLESLGIKA